MTRYVIYKNSRSPRNDSYFGPSWDRAGIRASYKETYESKEAAEFLAKKLSSVNPVGFSVHEIKE